jgi:putative DNA primase/helicase
MKIISADQRLTERRGAKILLLGPTGVGKTSLLRTLDSRSTLFVDVEAGDLCVQDVEVDTIRLDDWSAARDLACRIGGPNPSFPPTACYSQSHYDAVGGSLENLDRYQTIFVDSGTAVSRLAFRWAEQQPEAFSDRSGKKDTRGAYGLLGREMINWLQQLQHARDRNVIFVAILEKITARQGAWKLPVLTGIINTPFLRADNSICEQPGYDATSGLLFKPNGQSFPSIPQQPSKDDAVAALTLLNRPIDTFPFVTPADRAVALSAILTALDRRSMATAPLHAFTAPTAGTGKSLLVDLVAILATGRLMPVISQGRNEDELEKRLGAALLAGDAAISLDNCDHVLQSAFLCQALTQQHLNIRVLGLSKNVETPVNVAIYATGNNLSIAGDLTRRTLLCALDPRCEHPERRRFDVDVIALARANRVNLVAAALTVLRVACGQRACRSAPAGFVRRMVASDSRAAVMAWSRRPLRYHDQGSGRRSATPLLATVLVQWRDNLGMLTAYTVQQVINRAINVNDFHVALLNVASSRTGSVVSNERLGRWLRKVEGRVVNHLTLKRTGNSGGYPTWNLTEA